MTWAIDFPLILTLLVVLSGIIYLIDVLFFATKRKATGAKQPLLIEYARSFFPVLLIVLLIRSFLAQPYRVPTGSLEPTILPGDFIVVNQFAYGLRLPVLNTKILSIGEPKRGDIVLFRWPSDPRIMFVKRVIGIPGDHIVYKDKVLTINGKVAKQKNLGMDLDQASIMPIPVQIKSENLPNSGEHKIFVRQDYNMSGDFDLTVPADNYFMMGDNRDNSDDSRYWGFVPEKNLVGKAFGTWMSWDSRNNTVRWNRLGRAIH
jgi:signal peptidase I